MPDHGITATQSPRNRHDAHSRYWTARASPSLEYTTRLRRYASQSCRAAPPSQAETATSTGARFDFGSYVKEHAVLVNEALDRLVPLQHPEDITEPMR